MVRVPFFITYFLIYIYNIIETNAPFLINYLPFTSTESRIIRKTLAITFFFYVFLCYGIRNTYAMHNGDEEEQGAVGGIEEQGAVGGIEEQGAVGGGEEEKREHMTQRLLQGGLQLPGDLEKEFLFNLLASGQESAALNLLEGEGQHIYFESPNPHQGNQEGGWVHQPLQPTPLPPQQGLFFSRQVSFQSGEHPYTSIPYESGGSEHYYASIGSGWGTMGRGGTLRSGDQIYASIGARWGTIGRGTPYTSPVPTLQRRQQQQPLDEETSTCCMKIGKGCCGREGTAWGRIRTCCGLLGSTESNSTRFREPQQGLLGRDVPTLPITTQPPPVNDEGRSGAKKKPGDLMQQLLDERQSQAGRHHHHHHYRRFGGQTQHVLEEEGVQGTRRCSCPSCRTIFSWCLPKTCCGTSRHDEHGNIDEDIPLEEMNLAVVSSGSTPSEERRSVHNVFQDVQRIAQNLQSEAQEPIYVNADPTQGPREETQRRSCPSCRTIFSCCFSKTCCGESRHDEYGTIEEGGMQLEEMNVVNRGPEGTPSEGRGSLQGIPQPLQAVDQGSQSGEHESIYGNDPTQGPREETQRRSCPSCRTIFSCCFSKTCCGESRHDEHGTIEERASLTHGSGEHIALAVLGQEDTTSLRSVQTIGEDIDTQGANIGEQGDPSIQEQPRAVSGSLHSVAQEEDLLTKCSSCKDTMCTMCTAIGTGVGGAACGVSGFFLDHFLGSAVKVTAKGATTIVAGIAGKSGMAGLCLGGVGGAALGAVAAPLLLYGCKKCGYECSFFDCGQPGAGGEQKDSLIQEQPRVVDGQNQTAVQESICSRTCDKCQDVFCNKAGAVSAITGGIGGCFLGCCLDNIFGGLSTATPMYSGIAGTNGLIGGLAGGVSGGLLCSIAGPVTYYLCKVCLTNGCRCSTGERGDEAVNRGSQEAMQPIHQGGEGSGDCDSEDDAIAGPSGIQASLPAGGNHSGDSRRQSLESQNSSTQSVSGSSVSSQPNLGLPRPIMKQSSPTGRPRVDLQHDMIPGYTPGGHISSLFGMQCVLGTISLQVVNTLRLLSLKAHETMPQSTQRFSFEKASTIRSQKGFRYSNRSKQIVSTNRPYATYAMFGFMDSYTSNLERKVRAGRAGLMTRPNQRWSIGLSYNRHADESKEYKGMQFRSAHGSVKAKTIVEGLSAVIAFNPEDKGLSGHLVTCHGWGKLKNTREFTHAGIQASAKGSPKVQLRGGLIQLGYTIPFSKIVSVTPYIETMVSIVRWNGYKESSSSLTCEISRNQEKVLERSIGIRNHWKIADTTQVQVWGSTILGNKHVSALTSKPIQTTRIRYQTAVPSHKKIYKKTEVGLSYETNITEDLQMSLNGRTRFEKGKDAGDKNIQWSLRYIY